MHNLDKKDLALIRELDFDARATISSLAKRIRVSKEVANYRLKRLLEKKVIQGFIAVIDSYKLGYQIYWLQIRFKGLSCEKKSEIVQWAKSNARISEIVLLAGKWDLALSFWARNPSRFNEIYSEFINKFGILIQRKSISIAIEFEHRPYNFLYDKPNMSSLTVGVADDIVLDEKDKIILDLLSKDCRMPLLEMAKKVGLTANAVKYRMRNLEQQKIICGYSTVLNKNYFNLNFFRVQLYLSDPSKKKDAKGFLRQQKDVISITDIIGAGDVRFEILCGSALRIYDLVNEMNRIKPGLVREFDEVAIQETELVDYFPNV